MKNYEKILRSMSKIFGKEKLLGTITKIVNNIWLNFEIKFMDNMRKLFRNFE